MQIDKLIVWSLVLIPLSVSSQPIYGGRVHTLRFFGVRVAVWVRA